MLRSIPIFLLSLVIILTSACGILPTPAPPPQLSATALPPKATALSELPPTWTPVPTLSPTNTFTPSPTNPPPTPTLDPDAYNIGAIMTPVSVAQAVDTIDKTTWKRIEGQTAVILIPPTYEELDFAGIYIEMMFGVMEAFTEGFTEFAEELGEEFGATPGVTQEIPDLDDLPPFDFILAIEETSQSAIILINVERGPDTSTEDLLNQGLSDSEVDFQLITRESINNAAFLMERVILDVEDEELGTRKQVIYVILGDQMAWNLVLTTPENLFEQNLPVFEAVVNSFVPLP